MVDIGWGSGGELLGEVVRLSDKYTFGDSRQEFYRKLIDLFEDYDCDTIDECRGINKPMDLAIEDWASQFEEDDDDDFPMASGGPMPTGLRPLLIGD